MVQMEQNIKVWNLLFDIWNLFARLGRGPGRGWIIWCLRFVIFYFAYSIALTSRITLTLTCPGY